MDHVLQETERNRQMANQIAYRTFTAHGFEEGIFPTGPKVKHLKMNFLAADHYTEFHSATLLIEKGSSMHFL